MSASQDLKENAVPKEPVCNVTPQDLVEFLEDNNCYDVVFPKWNQLDLIRAISFASVARTLAFTTDDKTGKVTGVCIAQLAPNRVMHVVGIVVTSKTAMANLLLHFTHNYPTHTLTGLRNGKLVHYDSEDLDMLYKHFRKQAEGKRIIV